MQNVLTFFSALLLSVSASTTIDECCTNIQGLIGSYLVNPVGTMGSLNNNYRLIFTNEYPAKHYINERFDIPELAEVADSQFDLQNLLILTNYSNDKFIWFQALVEHVLYEKQNYDSIYRPMIRYLRRIFKELSEDQQNEFETIINKPFEYFLACSCGDKDHYDLVFEILIDKPLELTRWFLRRDKPEKVFAYLKANPDLVESIKSFLISNNAGNDDDESIGNSAYNKVRWLVGCILYDTSEHFYSNLLTNEPGLLQRLENIDIISLKVPDSELPRVYAQFKKIFQDYVWSNVDQNDQDVVRFAYLYNLIIDIRYGPEAPEFDFSHFDSDNLQYFAKVALLGNKKELFARIVNSPRIDMNFEKLIQNFAISFGKPEDSKFIFDVYEASNGSIKELFHRNENFFKLAINYYAVKHLRIENERVIGEFVATEKLSALGFPFELYLNCENSLMLSNELKKVLQKSNFLSEEIFMNFLFDYENLFIEEKKFKTSYSFIEFVSKSSAIMNKFIDLGIKLIPHFNLSSVLNCINSSNSNELKQFLEIEYDEQDLTALKSKEQLKKYEEITGTTVADCFLSPREWSVSKFFKWRFVIKYWIKSEHKKRIKEITNPFVLELLKLEFYDEINEIDEIDEINEIKASSDDLLSTTPL